MKHKIILSGLICLTIMAFGKPPKNRQIYQIRVYSMKTNDQVNMLDQYLKTAYLPALHKFGIKTVGVFKVSGIDTAIIKRVYVIAPFASIQSWKKVTEEIAADHVYANNSHAFVYAQAENAPYLRTETIITEAFPAHPVIEMPILKSNKTDRVYELRSYESPTEHLFERKVTMFNAGDEVGLFKRLNFNAIFYSSVLAGNRMPNLMYMISFENMADHDEHWKQFGNDPQWKKISTMPEYENKVSVSHIDSILMHPTDYSDF